MMFEFRLLRVLSLYLLSQLKFLIPSMELSFERRYNIKKAVATSWLIHYQDMEIDRSKLQGNYMSSQSETVFYSRGLWARRRSLVFESSQQRRQTWRKLRQTQTNKHHHEYIDRYLAISQFQVNIMICNQAVRLDF